MFMQMQKKAYIVGRHHEMIFDALDDVVKGKTRKLIINIAPRYGKTLLASQMFIAYGLALNPEAKFLHLSYSDTLAKENSEAVKDIVKDDFFMEVFTTRVRYGSDTKSKWLTEQGGGVYATSTLGQVTGFGAGQVEAEDKELDDFTARFNPDEFSGAIVIDDPIKPEDALSDVAREAVNRRFETTIRNRVNSRKTPIIVIMQRLHEMDLCGYLQSIEPDEWKVLTIPCIQTDENGNESALWPFKHSLEELRAIERANSYVFQTQYMQNAKPLEGLMYTSLRTYETLPIDKQVPKRMNYTDTADTGADYLCSIDYLEYRHGMYVLDVLYTNKPMEYTEPETARMMAKDEVQTAYIESNNGGRGFARNVEKNIRYLGNSRTRVVTFTQSANKVSRIFTRAAEVQNLVFFPSGWDRMWHQFYDAVTKYRKEGGNAHDDAPDALTGMCEKFTGGVSKGPHLTVNNNNQ